MNKLNRAQHKRFDVGSDRPFRLEEKGQIDLTFLGTVLLRFERHPVWLLYMSKDMVDCILIDQFSSFTNLDSYFKQSNIDTQLYSSLILHLGFEKFRFGATDLDLASVCLFSGSIQFLNDHTNVLRQRNAIFVTGHTQSQGNYLRFQGVTVSITSA